MHPTLFSHPQTSLTTLLSLLTPPSPSTGCNSPLPPNLTSGDPSINIPLHSPLSSPNTTLQSRRYRIHIPTTYPKTNDDPRPLLLTFNGQFQPTASIENYTLFSHPAFNPNAIAVYPEGISDQWLGDPAAPPSTQINDIQFVSDVLDDLEAHLCIDRNRIYGAGFSNGGGLTGLLACNETVGGRFAALAGVAGAYYKDESLTEPLFGEGCKGGGKVPYLEIHGEKDAIIAYNGSNAPSPDTFAVADFVRKMVELNGCFEGEEIAGLEGLGRNESTSLNEGNVTKHSWSCGGREDVVVHYKVKDLGHGWPSTVFYGGILDEYRLGPTNWNASEVIGEWFGRWTRRGPEEGKGDEASLLEYLQKWTV